MSGDEAPSTTVAVLSALSPEQTASFAHRVISDNGHLPLPSQDEQQQQLQWHIKNKYYSATVSFQCLTGDLHAALEKIQSVPAVVVLVGDIEQVDVRLLGKCNWPELDIKLLVALASGPLLPHEVEQASDLALDSEFEFVDGQALPGSVVCASADSDSDEEDFESVGIPRIREALQAHMWPASEADTPGTPSIEAAAETPFEDDFAPFVSAASAASLGESPAPPDLASDPAASELDDFDSLSKMLGELKMARDHSLSLNSDMDRRAFAEEATKRFLKGLGRDDVSLDGSSDGELS